LLPELRNLRLASSCLTSRSKTTFCVPESIGFVGIGSCAYVIEGAAKGEQLSRTLFLAPKRQRFQCLQKDLPHCVEVALQIAELMHGNPEVDEIDPTWWQMAGHEGLPSDLRQADPGRATGFQHGDFTIENVFLDLTTKKMTVIDLG